MTASSPLPPNATIEVRVMRWLSDRCDFGQDPIQFLKDLESRLQKAEARADVLKKKLDSAIEAIDRAEPNLHSPWCNGVHEGGACEGDYMMWRFMEDLRRPV